MSILSGLGKGKATQRKSVLSGLGKGKAEYSGAVTADLSTWDRKHLNHSDLKQMESDAVKAGFSGNSLESIYKRLDSIVSGVIDLDIPAFSSLRGSVATVKKTANNPIVDAVLSAKPELEKGSGSQLMAEIIYQIWIYYLENYSSDSPETPATPETPVVNSLMTAESFRKFSRAERIQAEHATYIANRELIDSLRLEVASKLEKIPVSAKTGYRYGKNKDKADQLTTDFYQRLAEIKVEAYPNETAAGYPLSAKTYKYGLCECANHSDSTCIWSDMKTHFDLAETI